MISGSVKNGESVKDWYLLREEQNEWFLVYWKMWYILQTNSDIKGYNRIIGIYDNREKARRRAIDPETAWHLFSSSRIGRLSDQEEYALKLVKHLMMENSWDNQFLCYLLSCSAIQESSDLHNRKKQEVG